MLVGLRLGLYLATIWSAVALLGSAVTGGRSLQRVGISLPTAIVGYAMVGLLSGTVWGLGRPLAQWWWGAALLGFIVALPACGILIFTVATDFHPADIVKLSIIMATVFGPAAGIILRQDAK